MLSLSVVRTAVRPDLAHPLFRPESFSALLHLLSQVRIRRRYVRNLLAFDIIGPRQIRLRAISRQRIRPIVADTVSMGFHPADVNIVI